MKTLVEIGKALEEGRVSSVELTKEYLAAIESDETNAFILPTPEHALAQAAASDRRRRKGEVSGRLEGGALGRERPVLHRGHSNHRGLGNP